MKLKEGVLKHFVQYQIFSDLVIDLVFSLTPFEGLGLISFCELRTTGLWTQCSLLAVLIPNTVDNRTLLPSSLSPWSRNDRLHQPLWTKSCLQQWLQADAGGKMGMAWACVIFALSTLEVCNSSQKERGTSGALQHLGGGQTLPGQDTLHFQNVSRPGPVCLHVANAVISSLLHFETSRLTSS